MSDQWIFFPCRMGDRTAWIFVNEGLRESISHSALKFLLRVRVPFNHPMIDGMPGHIEFQPLADLENALQSAANKSNSLYVGRVTVDSYRHFFIYTAAPEAYWAGKLSILGQQHNYPVEFTLERDENHHSYWSELYPDDDDRQVIDDLKVLTALRNDGDEGTISRHIDHRACFPGEEFARQFAAWANNRRYQSVELTPGDAGQFFVKFSHVGTLRLPDITTHTVAIKRKSTELGGTYDGWETAVCKV